MRDFLRVLVEDVMSHPPVTISPETPLRDVEDVFEKHDFNSLPVVDRSGALIGLVTKLDLLGAFRFDDESLWPAYEEIMQHPAKSVMCAEVLTVTPRAPLTRILEKLVATGVKSFPVVDGDALVGIVAREDVLAALRRTAEPS